MAELAVVDMLLDFLIDISEAINPGAVLDLIAVEQ